MDIKAFHVGTEKPEHISSSAKGGVKSKDSRSV